MFASFHVRMELQYLWVFTPIAFGDVCQDYCLCCSSAEWLIGRENGIAEGAAERESVCLFVFLEGNPDGGFPNSKQVPNPYRGESAELRLPDVRSLRRVKRSENSRILGAGEILTIPEEESRLRRRLRAQVARAIAQLGVEVCTEGKRRALRPEAPMTRWRGPSCEEIRPFTSR